MSIRHLISALILNLIVLSANAQWNGVFVKDWNGIAPTSWNGTQCPIGYTQWFQASVSMGVTDVSQDEISDLARNNLPANDAYLWAVDDGILTKVLVLNATTGAASGEWTITGFNGNDVESMASATVGGVNYIWIGDTGNNANSANSRGTGIDVRIVRVVEPTITGSNGTITADNVVLVDCAYPAGNAPSLRDVECMLSDPATGDIYLVTKRISPVKVYRLNFALSYSGTQTLDYVTDMTNDATFNTISDTPSGNNGYATGGCITPNGQEIFIRSYSKIYRWKRTSGETIGAALARPYDNILTNSYTGGGRRFTSPNSEPQGESICTDRLGKNIYHTSEFVTAAAVGQPPLFRMSRLATTQTTVSFQQGVSSYTGTTDTYLDSTNPTTSQASSTSLVADFDYSPSFPTISRTRQCLLRFDVSTIPSTATVTAAYIDFYINTEGLGIDLFKMLTTWADTATYNSLTAGVSTNNTEAASTASASIGDTTVGSELDTYVGFIRVNLPVADVQGWVTNSATNFGYLIQAISESSGDGLQLDSADSVTQSRRPKLTVQYQP